MSQTNARMQKQNRLACDRCHEQKLRCKVEKQDPPACARCIKACLPCAWSPPLRSGRPSKKRRIEVQSTPPETEEEDSSPRARPDVNETSHRSSPAIRPFPSPTSITGAAGEQSYTPATDSMQYNISPFPLEDTAHLVQGSAPSLPNDSNTARNPFDFSFFDLQGLGYPIDGMTLGSTPLNVSSNFPNIDFSSQRRFETPNLMSNIPQSAQSSESQSCHHQNGGKTFSPPDSVESCVVLLSDLSSNLVKLRKDIEKWWEIFATPATFLKKLQDPTPHSHLDPNTYPLGELYCSSQRLLDAAQKFFIPSPMPKSSSFGGPDGERGRRSECRASTDGFSRRSRSSSIADSLSSVELSEHENTPEVQPDDDIESDPLTHHPELLVLDLPLALMFLSCYIRLLGIYEILFIQLFNFLYSVESADCKRILNRKSLCFQLLPNLNMNGFVPTSFGSLQMLLIVQVSCHMLDQLDRYLGVESFIKTQTEHREAESSASSYTGCNSHPSMSSIHDQSRMKTSSRVNEARLSKGLVGILSPETLASVLDAEWPAAPIDTAQSHGQNGGIARLRRYIRKVKTLIRRSMYL